VTSRTTTTFGGQSRPFRENVSERTARVSHRTGGGLLFLVGAVLLGIAVSAGWTNVIDQYAVDHLMPGLYPFVAGRYGVVVFASKSFMSNPNRIVNRIADTVTQPASVVPATAIVIGALGFDAIYRRRLVEDLLLAAGYMVGNAAELVGKAIVQRPQLVLHGTLGELPLRKFTWSYPSGHTIRALFVAAVIAYVWPLLRGVAVLWSLAVVGLLEVAGTHTPTDIAGGLLVAGGLLLLVRPSTRAA
jgi:membrane-associated phospholipid phosphatase